MMCDSASISGCVNVSAFVVVVDAVSGIAGANVVVIRILFHFKRIALSHSPASEIAG
jgi:hypothetical protein